MNFGQMQKSRLVMKLFYAAKQKPGEDVASWAARMEDLMDQAVELEKGTEQDQNDLLKEQFWNGLRDELQEETQHKYDTIKNFDDLEVYIKEVEEKRRDKVNTSSSHRGAREAYSPHVTTRIVLRDGGTQSYVQEYGDRGSWTYEGDEAGEGESVTRSSNSNLQG